MIFPGRDSQSGISSPCQGLDHVLVSVKAFDMVVSIICRLFGLSSKESWYSRAMNIRKATISDSLTLSRLTRDVQRLHAQIYPTVFRMPESDDFAVRFFEEMLSDPVVTIFIAEENGEPEGCILCKLVDRLENPFTFAARVLLIDQISVRPMSQGHGIGAALMWQAEALASELGVQRIQLDSWGFNINAHQFFENQGFEKFNFRFWKWVDGK